MGFHKTGGCACGEIRYQLTGEPLYNHVCHCNSCRKTSGTAFWQSMFIVAKDFELLSGSPAVAHPPQQFGESSKYYCADCGSGIYACYSLLAKELILIPGSLDAQDWFEPQAHIYVQHKLSWVELPEGVPCFEELYDREKVWPRSSLDRLVTAT